MAVAEGTSELPIREFESFTDDLHHMADWLIICKVGTVVMESTGIYLIPVFEILESKGFEVKLVNVRHVKNVPGRKSDVLDCQWLQRLHTCIALTPLRWCDVLNNDTPLISQCDRPTVCGSNSKMLI